MKKFLGFFLTGVLVMGIISAFTLKTDGLNKKKDIDIPEEVNKIIQDRCYGCHNSESKNEKGKKELLFDQLNGLSKAKQAAKLNKIKKEVAEKKMPPEKFLAKYPEKTPTKEEYKKLIKWAKSASKEL